MGTVLVVGFDVGDGHKEGAAILALPAIFYRGVKEFQGKVRDAVGTVAREVPPVHVLVKDIAAVAVGGELQHVGGTPEALVAAPQVQGNGLNLVILVGLFFQLTLGGQMPLADVGCLVACLLKPVGKGLYILGQGDAVAEATSVGGILARLEDGTAGAADRLG